MAKARAPGRAWAYLAGVFGLALGVRLWWVHHWIVVNYPDQPSLEQYAANVAHGLYYGTHGAYWPPAFIFLAGFVERWFGTGHHFLAVRSADALIGAVGAVLTADIARRLGRSAEAGLIAGLLVALYGPLIYYSDTFLNATLDATMAVAVLDAAVAMGDAPRLWLLALNGVLLGLAALTKPTLLPLIVPAAVHWGLNGGRHRWRRALLWGTTALMIALAVNVPWTLRNLRVTGAPVFVDDNGGVNLLIAHNPGSDGAWVNLGDHNPVLLKGGGYDRPATNAAAMRAGLRYFIAHPGEDLRQALAVEGGFWTLPDPDIATYGDRLAPIRRDLHLPLVSFRWLYAAGIIGLLTLWRLWRRVLILPLILLGFSGGLGLFFFAPRFRLPMAGLVAVAAGVACAQLGGWARQLWARSHARAGLTDASAAPGAE